MRFPAYRSGDVLRIMRLIGLISDGAPGHGLVHLLLKSAAELGCLWSEGLGDGQGWTSRPFLCLLDLFNTFMLLYWVDGVTVYLLTCVVGRGSGVDLILIGTSYSCP